MISLVTITHKRDPNALVPFINGKAPLVKIAVEERILKDIEAMGFVVERHQENYDALEAANVASIELRDVLSAQLPTSTEESVNYATTEEYVENATDENTDDEAAVVEAFKVAVESATTIAKLRAIMSEYQVTLPPSVIGLKNMKTALFEYV